MHGLVLALLTSLFFLRVLGQALVEFFSVGWLPSTESWTSGLIPYSFLLTIQMVMLIGMVKIVADVRRGRGYFATKRPRWCALIGFSAVYASSMALRYILTMVFFPGVRWLGGAIFESPRGAC